MTVTIQKIEYYYTIVDDKHGKAYWLLEHLRQSDVNLIAFTAFPRGAGRSQLDFVPDDAGKLLTAAKKAGIELVGPKQAFLARGDDKSGAMVEAHYKLSTADINVYAANGVSDGTGMFGYIFWVKSEDYQRAAVVLGV